MHVKKRIISKLSPKTQTGHLRAGSFQIILVIKYRVSCTVKFLALLLVCPMLYYHPAQIIHTFGSRITKPPVVCMPWEPSSNWTCKALLGTKCTFNGKLILPNAVLVQCIASRYTGLSSSSSNSPVAMLVKSNS